MRKKGEERCGRPETEEELRERERRKWRELGRGKEKNRRKGERASGAKGSEREEVLEGEEGGEVEERV